MEISLTSQVVMPTVEADVAFGLGKLNLPRDEVKTRVSKALDAVGMSKYLQVRYASMFLCIKWTMC
jgi:energy-coupling factor transporter ATP-binding protein EcfA2